MKEHYILGIESSCDETSAAVLMNTTELSNVIATQTTIHQYFGGVVPELASRAHQQKIIPVVDDALKKAGIAKNDLSAISFTRGPGLAGALHVGVSFAKSMAYALNIPMMEVNHMQGHVLAHFIQQKNEFQPPPEFPFLCLTVSGGHTQIVLVEDFLKMTIIGETIDDAAGEAFDKSAKILGLPYPGGPLIDAYAAKGQPVFKFTHPQIAGYNYSFSGLKTQFLYFINEQVKKNENFVEENLNDICASIQKVIIDVLMAKLMKASADTGISQLAIAGGVSANSGLRNALLSLQSQNQAKVFIPPFKYCTDNAAMIAVAGYYKFLNHQFASLNVEPLARMPF